MLCIIQPCKAQNPYGYESKKANSLSANGFRKIKTQISDVQYGRHVAILDLHNKAV